MTDKLGHVVNTIMLLIINNSIERATNELFNESSRNSIKCKYARICSKSSFFIKNTIQKTIQKTNILSHKQTNKLKHVYGIIIIFMSLVRSN